MVFTTIETLLANLGTYIQSVRMYVCGFTCVYCLSPHILLVVVVTSLAMNKEALYGAVYKISVRQWRKQKPRRRERMLNQKKTKQNKTKALITTSCTISKHIICMYVLYVLKITCIFQPSNNSNSINNSNFRRDSLVEDTIMVKSRRCVCVFHLLLRFVYVFFIFIFLFLYCLDNVDQICVSLIIFSIGRRKIWLHIRMWCELHF